MRPEIEQGEQPNRVGNPEEIPPPQPGDRRRHLVDGEPSGEKEGESTSHHHDGERRDERGDTKLGNEKSPYPTDRATEKGGRKKPDPDHPVRPIDSPERSHQKCAENGGESNQASDREIDSSGQNDQGHPNRDHRDDDDAIDDRDEVGPLEKVGLPTLFGHDDLQGRMALLNRNKSRPLRRIATRDEDRSRLGQGLPLLSNFPRRPDHRGDLGEASILQPLGD